MSAFSGILSNLRIGVRIYGGFLLVLALLALIAVISGLGLKSLAGAFAESAKLTDNALGVSQIDRQLVGLRRNAFVFNTNGDPKAAQRIDEIAADLHALLPAAIDAAPTPESKEKLTQIQGLAEQVLVSFAKAKTLRQQRTTLFNDTLSSLGVQAHDLVVDIMDISKEAGDLEEAVRAGAALDDVMSTRVYSVRYLMTGDEQSANEAHRYSTNLAWVTGDALLSHATDPKIRGKAEQLVKLGGLYAKAFDSLATIVKESDRLTESEITKSTEQASTLAGQLMVSQRSDLDQVQENSQTTIVRTSSITITLSIGALVLGVLLAWLTARSLVGPVKGMTETMNRLAAGDHGIAVPALENRDEIGDMGRAVQVFKENAIRVTAMTGEQEAAKAKAAAEQRRAMNAMADAFEGSVKGIVQTVSSAATEMQATAGSMSSTAERTARQATTVAAAAEQASANVQTVAAAAEELTSSIGEIGRQVSESSRISQMAVGEAVRTNEMVQGLAAAVGKISDVVALINDIASQTNLLALNATIEAARAGEAGKGFAVVASEVKNLANQTARATDEIGGQIAAVQSATAESVGAIRGIGGTISKINEIASAIAAAVEEQGAATQEIARNIQQAATGTQQVTSNIEGVTQAAADTGAAAEQVLDSAGQLSQQAALLSTEVDGFVTRIRAG